MKTEINNYSKLLVDEIRSGVEVHSAVIKLTKLLKRHHHQTIIRSVLLKAERIIKESRDYAAPALVVANDMDAKKHINKIGKRPEPQVVIDPKMIGGYIIRENYQMTDQSYRSKLVDWYRRTTAGN